LRKGFLYTAILVCVTSVSFAADANSDANLQSSDSLSSVSFSGDQSDGSRAVPIHIMPLIDDQGGKIIPDVEPILPFSTRQTCGACHDYEKISHGWHFNAAEPNVPSGRVGQPWIFVDAATGTQIPLSYRKWPGAFRPESVGLTSWKFVQLFGRQMPGGGIGEIESSNPDEIVRGEISGKLEINCLSCHDGDPAHNQAEFGDQIARQNLRWAAAATCSFASVVGKTRDMRNSYDPFMPQPLPMDDPKAIAPAVIYREGTFDQKNQVLFDIVRKMPSERCYFCHSNYDAGKDKPGKWAVDEDVHLAAGLTCVDCHRNGLEHDITRGYDGETSVSENPLAAVSSCQSCHDEGRLGAPEPEHLGIPPVHFDKLACTACHSGPRPEKQTIRTKTARAHGLGTYNVNKADDALPHIIYPVFAKQADGKIGPHKLVWPSFWGALKDDEVTPIDMEIVRRTVGEVFSKAEPNMFGGWPALTLEDITKGLASLGKEIQGAVYVAGGKVYSLDSSGKLSEQLNNPAAKPYLWPIAHDVRPRAQSLGAGLCQDCHSTDSGFFFADVEVDVPIASEKGVKKMVEFEELSPVYTKLFAWSFVFRLWLKVIAIGVSAILAAVLLLYALKALDFLMKMLGDKK
ncbi:MAG: hypothetical protein WC476_03215, partial [Phycisphaerae bacterium]|jgi:hypothetical protein